MNFVARVACVGALFCGAQAAQAAIVVDQSTLVVAGPNEYLTGSAIRYTSTNLGGGATRLDIQDQVQSVTVGVTGQLTRIGLQLYGITAGGTYNFTVQKGAVYNPDATFNDTNATLIKYFSNVTLPNYGQVSAGGLAYFDLSDLNVSVTAGDILSFGVSANPGSRAAWVLGAADYDTDEDTQLISYAGGYNVVTSEAIFSADPSQNTFQRFTAGFDRGFVTYVDAATTADSPLMPTASGENGAEAFTFTAAAGERVFIDPVYASGFDYVLGGGSPNILDVLFPALTSDGNGYSIYTLDGTLLGTATAGTAFAFGPAGVTGFKVRGIDGLVQGDPFVTGLTFVSAGTVTITQTPVAAAAVPEPATWAMLLLGFGMTGASIRYRRRSTRIAYA